MLKIENINFGYSKENSILSNVNLTIQRGEIVGIYGKSGAGKSTLAKIIAGYLTPNSGVISIENSEPTRENTTNPIQLIGQHPEKAINPHWQMKRVLEEADVLNSETMQLFGIKNEWLHRFPSQLSGGELQRFCLARAITPRTQFLIADEITTMLDAVNQAYIWKTILQVSQKQQFGVLVISHELSLLNRVCNRVVDFNTIFS